MADPAKHLLTPVDKYYTAKLGSHGATPAGVDWKDEQSQRLRFEQLVDVISGPEPFLVNDLGCGYGALFAFLAERFTRFSYAGIDLAPAMVDAAKQQFGSDPRCAFSIGASCAEIADYTLASGIFNVMLQADPEQWRVYLLQTLDDMNESSRRGFAFNCLTRYSDPQRMRADLYYADPCALFDHCKRRYARNVALLHDYGLYEFTLIVRKET